MRGKNYKGHYIFGDSETLVAKDSLKDILRAPNPTIEARAPFGVFKFLGINAGKNKKLNITVDDLRAVCFSETPLRELKSFYQSTQNEENFDYKTNKYQKYGVAFRSEFIRSKGGQPVFYYDRRNERIRSSIESLGNPDFQQTTLPILPFFEFYGPKIKEPQKEIDFRWEREWRIIGDFNFKFIDIAFGICPENEISSFENLTSNEVIFIDPGWSMDKLINYLKNKNRNDLISEL